MKKDIHPKYQAVVFHDISCGKHIFTSSTATSKQTIKWEDGKEYPLIPVETSSASHPFFTGKSSASDTGGRAEKFRKKFAKK